MHWQRRLCMRPDIFMKRQRKGLAAFLAYMTVVSLVTGCGADGEAVSGEAEEALQQEETDVKIGRASCRERVYVSV